MGSGIYEINNLINSKRYVGSAANFKKRWHEHKKFLKKNIHRNRLLQNAWNKHGEENFVFEVIEDILDKSKLIEREQYYIDTLKPEYNICKIADSSLGVKRSEETIERISKAHIGVNSGEDHWTFGKPRSEETKEKIRIAASKNVGEKASFYGKKHSEESRRKISKNRRGKSVKEDHWTFGKPRSEETREKISKSLSGDKNPNFGKSSFMKGKKHSEETKQKISVSSKGKHKNNGMCGKFHSDETRKTMSESHKKYWEKRRKKGAIL